MLDAFSRLRAPSSPLSSPRFSLDFSGGAAGMHGASAHGDRRLALLLQAVESAREAVLITTAELDEPGPEILYVNPAFEEMTGYAEEEVLGRTPRLLQGPLTDQSVLDRVRQALEAGESTTEEAINYRQDGTPFVVEWSLAPVRGADGGVTHWVSVQRDITERRRLEREIVDISEQERRRIGRALHDVLASDLTAATLILDRLVGALRADASPEADDLEQAVDLVRNAANQVRDLSHLLSPADLEDDGLPAALERLASRTGSVADVECTVDVQAGPAVSDPSVVGHLYRIAQEAVHNAVHHAEPTQIAIRLRPADGGYELAVADDGIGLPEAVAETDDLSGIGLHLMRYRAERVGGAFTIEAREGGGTVVRCTLPAEALEAPDETADEPAGRDA
jgi:PAS domain S-box-containing protein